MTGGNRQSAELPANQTSASAFSPVGLMLKEKEGEKGEGEEEEEIVTEDKNGEGVGNCYSEKMTVDTEKKEEDEKNSGERNFEKKANEKGN